jgi:hypothetical protein
VSSPQAARLAAVLFVVTAGLFTVGVSTERDQHGESAEIVTDNHLEATETGEAHREEHEKVLGLDVESPATIALAVVLSVVLAGALWSRPMRLVAAAAVAFAVAFVVLDAAEVVHQVDGSQAGLALLAITVAVGHTGAALAAGRTALEPA